MIPSKGVDDDPKQGGIMMIPSKGVDDDPKQGG